MSRAIKVLCAVSTGRSKKAMLMPLMMRSAGMYDVLRALVFMGEWRANERVEVSALCR
jgi:hypothetical protein